MTTAVQQTISPIDGIDLRRAPELASAQEIEAALQRGVDAQRDWKRVPLAERAAICRRMVDAGASNAPTQLADGADAGRWAGRSRTPRSRSGAASRSAPTT